VLDKSLTVVLPVYNRETSIGRSVAEILDLASELTRRFEILIIDDGSTDATFEVAEELASRFPQISLRRHRHRRGLGAMLEVAGRRTRSDVVILHDGITRIDPEELRTLWWDYVASPTKSETGHPLGRAACSQLGGLSAAHAAMEEAHARVLGFHLVAPIGEDGAPLRREDAARPANLHVDVDPSYRRRVGEIPALPRPKFLTALAHFAMGE
jgi:glycosyltransferase involved in cell wall biosynthesis